MAGRAQRRAHTRLNPKTGRPIQVRAHTVATRDRDDGLLGPDRGAVDTGSGDWLIEDDRRDVRDFAEPDSPYQLARFDRAGWVVTLETDDGHTKEIPMSAQEWEVVERSDEVSAARFLLVMEQERQHEDESAYATRYWVGGDPISWVSVDPISSGGFRLTAWGPYSSRGYRGIVSNDGWARIRDGAPIGDVVDWSQPMTQCVCGVTSPVGSVHDCTYDPTGDVVYPDGLGFERATMTDGALVITRTSGEEFRLEGATAADLADLGAGAEKTWARWLIERDLTKSGGVLRPGTMHNEFTTSMDPIAASYPRPSELRAWATDNPGGDFAFEMLAWIPVDVDDLDNPPRDVAHQGHVPVRADQYGRLQINAEDISFGVVDDSWEGRGPTNPEVTAALAPTMVDVYTEGFRVAERQARDRFDRHLRHADRVQRAADRCLVSRAAAAERFHPESLYGQDLDRFQAAYEAARARRRNGEPLVPFVLDDATDGMLTRESGRGFGLEIEYEFPDLDLYDDEDEIEIRNERLAKAFCDAGLIPAPEQNGYHSDRGSEEGFWAFERDESVHGEVVSPVLFDERESWERLEQVCQILRAHGAEITENCGGHIHVGVGDFDHDPKIHERLLSEYQANEDFLFRVAADPSTGRHRGTGWCNPVWEVPSGYERVGDIGQVFRNHHAALNFCDVSGAVGDHVEFRFFDGSLDPGVIQTRVRLAGAMAEAAMADRSTDSLPPERLGGRAQRVAAAGGRLRGDAWREGLRRPAAFLDSLFRRDSDKDSVIALWAVNRNARP